jgi:hypothetical protein
MERGLPNRRAERSTQKPWLSAAPVRILVFGKAEKAAKSAYLAAILELRYFKNPINLALSQRV